jgi:hypothetical protein
VAVTPAVLWAAIQGVWVGQLHEVDHLSGNPQPGTPVWQLVVGAVGVDIQACMWERAAGGRRVSVHGRCRGAQRGCCYLSRQQHCCQGVLEGMMSSAVGLLSGDRLL